MTRLISKEFHIQNLNLRNWIKIMHDLISIEWALI
jgi:hypothetical protein